LDRADRGYRSDGSTTVMAIASRGENVVDTLSKRGIDCGSRSFNGQSYGSRRPKDNGGRPISCKNDRRG